MRKALDTLYGAALWLSALCLVAIALMVGLQLAGRLIDGTLALIGRQPEGIIILSLAEIAGYLLAAASFFALAPTLKSGAHIRVTMLLSGLSESMRRWLEIWAFAASATFSAYITWNVGSFTYYSWRFNEVSSGLIPVPLALPQAAMAAGIFILTVALLDELVIVVRRGHPTFRKAEEALTLGKEG